MTETAELADVVLPAALWGEKTGTFTNYDRTVHISHKAVEPPGEARADMDIFLDFARRMDFRDKDGAPLLKWSTPEECFAAWKACSKGWPCDYSGLSYAKLSGKSGIQWPCNDQYPDGKERLYDDFHFPTAYEECGTFGHDLETGGHILPEQYKAENPNGRAILKPADYHPPYEETDSQYPFMLTTGRVVYQFHTRTKTGRSPQLQQAAPEAYAQINEQDAQSLGIAEGDMVEITSRRATVQVKAKVGGILPGHVFIPFHYGYWDEPGKEHYEANGRAHAANELTVTDWDMVSKQPNFKNAAVKLSKVGSTSLASKVVGVAGQVKDRLEEYADKLMGSAHKERSHVPDYLGYFKDANEEFMEACAHMARQHAQNAEIREGAELLAGFSREAVDKLKPFIAKYGDLEKKEPRKLRDTLFPGPRAGGFGLLRDLHALYVLAADVEIAAKILKNAAQELRDEALYELFQHLHGQNKRQLSWVDTMIKESAAQSVVVPS